MFGGEYSVLDVRRVRQEQQRLQQQLIELESENDSLKNWVQKLEFDSATIERLARERYGMVRPGELLYIVAEPKDSLEDFQNR
ncbi:uncharacterized protein METZ01_LOCUS171010 [marine metagenome]|uniref:Septum formation initiator family protein n=1 Tax=marine metagenome TaxID=408172 RepID=A0A382BWG6_9ZZZZ